VNPTQNRSRREKRLDAIEELKPSDGDSMALVRAVLEGLSSHNKNQQDRLSEGLRFLWLSRGGGNRGIRTSIILADQGALNNEAFEMEHVLLNAETTKKCIK